jgi:glutamate synthase domain-containing protein 3
MSGGIAYVFDDAGTFRQQQLSPLLEMSMLTEDIDRGHLHALIERHVRFSGSRRARHVLSHWTTMARRFVRVMSYEYKEALQQRTSVARPAGHG